MPTTTAFPTCSSYGPARIRGAADSDGDGLTDGFEVRARAKFIHHPDEARHRRRRHRRRRRGRRRRRAHGASASRPPARARSSATPTATPSPTAPRSPRTRRTRTKADTDDDGLDDAAELAAHTNPLNPDTDGDGILDGADITTQTAQVGRRPGLADRRRRPRRLARGQEPGGRRAADERAGPGGPAYDISLPSGTTLPARARSRSRYDPARAGGSESDLRVFWFDEAHGIVEARLRHADGRHRREHRHDDASSTSRSTRSSTSATGTRR